ncbi:Phenylacetate-coenzyme A ligase [Pseudodesulfovibrio hydrargyri]|uniref:Phenylacetate-coenzyme A ligase n=1 Tax=Pseudodesulfovibrio hydrargyri TaxID=2125990 RepID=A0A1J5MRE5_9BACT|nr:phenylacetate--CoA ligase family protein [Pseudodesulfovibrio hydrargyri]OIQ49166.1 Phenylacetate-coenzyme A ligase [Pseudodesulfovibrio hydrargyri]
MRNLYETFHKHVIHPLWTWKDGEYNAPYVKEFERTQYLGLEEIRDLQFQRLEKLVRESYAFCPFYKERWDEHGFHPDQLKSLEDTHLIPMVSKLDVQQYADRMIRTDKTRDDLVRNMTGGSTGEPVVFYMDPERVATRAASTVRHNRWAGVDVCTMRASLWGHPRDIRSFSGEIWDAVREKWIYRNMFLDTSSIDEQKMREFFEALDRERPEAFITYANSMYLFTRFMEDRGLKLGYTPKAIISTAEMLEDSRREAIERVMGCPVFNRYGSRETSVIASECDRHDGMHVNAEALLLETVKDGRQVAPGELGEVVITDLLNYGMPLIRYRIRDVATTVEGVCACGRGLPRIKLSGGRVTDFLVTPSGKIVSGASMTIFLTANAPNVQRMQMYQARPELVEFRVVRGEGYTVDTDDYIRSEAAKYLGGDVEAVIRYVDEIEPAESGKLLYCISEVSPFL